ncbi:ASCH domain-containing protein [Halosimplex pelagicum]|uniref:ASCH domain-containing protein n=1 Tax=Halosimplex pelagicum TaxID=869886 RepID=A0A7D5PCJ8_9EURY|nr:ASCH domain-containing protein [Halosimplex pelagicum]QLH83385.1 ASCH domain-containing protein [Halosimplex pelagicum]
MSRLSELEFAEDLVVPILDGDKTGTVRYGPVSVYVGEEVSAITPDGSEFATIEITRSAKLNAIEALAVLDVFGAEYPADTVDELLEGVNRHYEASIRPETTVRVLVFEVVR